MSKKFECDFLLPWCQRDSIQGSGSISKNWYQVFSDPFTAHICAFLTSPESHCLEQKWLSYILIFIKACILGKYPRLENCTATIKRLKQWHTFSSRSCDWEMNLWMWASALHGMYESFLWTLNNLLQSVSVNCPSWG